MAHIGAYGGYDWSDVETTGPDFEPNGLDVGFLAGFRADAMLEKMDGLGIGLNGAIEAFYGISEADDDRGAGTVQKEDKWGVSFRPGLSFMDRIVSPLGATPYAILGYRRSEFETSAAGFSDSENYNGFELGIGTQLLAYGDWGIRAEYAHMWYASENGVDPASNDVRVALSYHF